LTRSLPRSLPAASLSRDQSVVWASPSLGGWPRQPAESSLLSYGPALHLQFALHPLSRGRSYLRFQRSDPTWQGLHLADSTHLQAHERGRLARIQWSGRLAGILQNGRLTRILSSGRDARAPGHVQLVAMRRVKNRTRVRRRSAPRTGCRTAQFAHAVKILHADPQQMPRAAAPLPSGLHGHGTAKIVGLAQMAVDGKRMARRRGRSVPGN